MRWVSLRNDTCLVGNVGTSPNDKTLLCSVVLQGLVDGSGANTKAAYADSVMRWFGVHAMPSGVEGGPQEVALRTEFQVGRPNPTGGAMTFNFQLAKESRTSLKIYNLTGQLVRSLLDGAVPAGAHEAVWDGRADNRMRVPTGVYLVRFEAGDYRTTKKAVVVR